MIWTLTPNQRHFRNWRPRAICPQAVEECQTDPALTHLAQHCGGDWMNWIFRHDHRFRYARSKCRQPPWRGDQPAANCGLPATAMRLYAVAAAPSASGHAPLHHILVYRWAASYGVQHQYATADCSLTLPRHSTQK